MAELGIIIAEKLIVVTASVIIEEIYDKLGYKSQLEDLNQTVCIIQKVLLDAESKSKLPLATQNYVEELKAAVYDADDLFDELNTLNELNQLDDYKKKNILIRIVRCFSGKKKEVSLAHKMSRKVQKINKQLDTVVNKHKNFKLSADGTPITRRGRDETYSFVNAEGIIGREGDKKEVIDMLLGPNNDDVHESFRFVTIVGMGGLGKTALAQLVYDDKEVEAEFPDPKLKLWVCVSDQDREQFDVTKILCKIIELVTDHKPDTTSTPEWVQRKFQEHIRGNKYLLVLDDVWNEDLMKWGQLCDFLKVGQKGSRILVTTRSLKTAEVIGKRHIHTLNGLSEKDSWELFESVAFNKEEQEHLNHPDLVDIGKKIVGNCYNIPLAIKAVGSLLRGQPLEKWLTIEQTIEHSGLGGIGNGDNSIMPILKLSYDGLSPSLKSCFSYCALFPKDLSMMKEQLIYLWMAQGYVVPLDEGQSMEDAAEEHFLILVRRCFFQDVKKDKYGNIESVKIHDLMHDVALEVGKQEIGVLSSNTTKLGDKVRHVYFAGGTFSQSYPFKSMIRSFIVTYNHSIALEETHIDSLKCLRVLCLQSTGIKGLSNSIGKLLHLRYLDLSRNNRLEALPSCITELHNLQTLDLSHCYNMRELSKDFSKLVKLRYLDLSSCKKLTNMTCLDKLTNLRYLDLSWCKKLTNMPCMDKLTNLRYLDLSYCQKLSNMPCMDKLTNLRHFNLSSCNELRSIPLGMDKLTNLRYLNLSGCTRLSSIPTSMGQLTSLGHFDLSGCFRLSSIPSSMGQLTSLRHFDLSGCRELSGMPSDMGKLTNLRMLPFFVVGMEMRGSTNEEQCMGDIQHLIPLTNIEGGIEIKIGKYYMNNDDGGGYLKSMKHLSEVVISFAGGGRLECEGVMEKLEPPSNLKKFKLEFYEGRTIPRWGRPHDNWVLFLPHLVEIKLDWCSKLEQVPLFSKLRNLKSLSLDLLNNLEYVENKSSNNDNYGEDLTTFFPSLESLSIKFLENLKGWWREEFLESLSISFLENLKGWWRKEFVEDDDDVNHIGRNDFAFPRLSKLEILYCPKLASFPSCSSLKTIAIGDLDLLKSIDPQCHITSLDIKYNEKVESLSEFGDVFRKYNTSLQILHISFCSNLRRIGRGGLEHLTALEELSFTYNDQLSFSDDEIDEDGMPWKSLPQSLRSLKFDSLKSMKSVPKGMQYLTSLRRLTFQDCENLRGLPEWVRCLSSLQSLSIRGCRAFKRSQREGSAGSAQHTTHPQH